MHRLISSIPRTEAETRQGLGSANALDSDGQVQFGGVLFAAIVSIAELLLYGAEELLDVFQPPHSDATGKATLRRIRVVGVEARLGRAGLVAAAGDGQLLGSAFAVPDFC